MKSINPNDITTLDTKSISYVTLKDGSMILIDDTVPQITNLEKKIVSNEEKRSFNKNKLSVTSSLSLSYEGIINMSIHKCNFNICSKISKNESFSLNGIKSTHCSDNNYNNIVKERSNFEKIKDLKKTIFYNNNRNFDSIEIVLKESQKNQKKNSLNCNNINNKENDVNLSKIEKVNPCSNIIDNNFIDNNLNNQESVVNSKINVNDMRKSNKNRKCGKGRKVGNSINSVCSLNIKAEEKLKIDLIKQFNNIVDKLNKERNRKPKYDLPINKSNNPIIKSYELYKKKNQNNIINMKSLNQTSLFDHVKKNTDFYKKLNNKKSNIRSKIFYESVIRSKSQLSSSRINNLRNKNNIISSKIIFPSNKIINV